MTVKDINGVGGDPTYYTSTTGVISDLGSVLDQQLMDPILKIARGAPSSTVLQSADGAPPLELSTIDPDSVVAEIGAAQSELNNAQFRKAHADLKQSIDLTSLLNDRAMEEFKEVQEKAEQALAKQGQTDVAGWCEAVFGMIGSVIGLVAAVVATPLTLGAAAVGVAGAVVGVLMSAMAIADMGVKEAGVTVQNADGTDRALEISIGGMVQAIVEQQIKDGTIHKFADEKAKQDYIMGMTITANLLVTIVMIGSGAMNLKNASNVAKNAADGVVDAQYQLVKLGENAKIIQTGTNGVGIMADIGEGTSKIATGAFRIQTAEINRDSEKHRANQQLFETLASVANNYTSSQMERIKDAVSALNESWDRVSSMIASLDASRGRVVRSMG